MNIDCEFKVYVGDKITQQSSNKFKMKHIMLSFDTI